MTIAIVGGGISGIAACFRAREAFPAADIVVFEKGDAIGGTWHVNSYPGAACDVRSHFYSLSFALNPQWSKGWSSQAEIQAYLLKAAEETGVIRHVKLRHKVEKAAWDGSASVWRLTVTNLATGRSFAHVARFLLAAPGALCAPAVADYPGQESFKGDVFHTAAWRHDLSLTGKRVAVIGTGASAAQVVPAIIDEVAALVLVQRTPAWIVPRGQFTYTPFERRLFAALPFLMWLYRSFMWYQHDLRFFAFIRVPKWWKGLGKIAAALARRTMTKAIVDPVLRDVLTPRYAMGCKRVLVSDDFYPALARPHATVVPAALVRFTPTGIVTADGSSHAVDAVVLATGFDVAASFPGIPFTGKDGYSLQKAWEEGGPVAYMGVAALHCPNLFFLVGPNTGLGHSSIIGMIEAQVDYIVAAMRHVVRTGKRSMTVKDDAHDAYNARLQADLEGTSWGGCKSWYNGQGKRNSTLWPHTLTAYWAMMRFGRVWTDYVLE